MKNHSVKDSCFNISITDKDVNKEKFKNMKGENDKSKAYEEHALQYE